MKILQNHFYIIYYIALISYFFVSPAYSSGIFETKKIEKQREEVRVHVDQARLLELERSGSVIILGNPSIADIAMQSGKLMVITGKSFGRTNLIVLDNEKKVIYSADLTVIGSRKNVVSVYMGSARRSFTCTPNCQTTLTTGDEPSYFEAVAKTTKEKFSVSSQASSAKPEGQ
ncbi:MAG: pilus assembly protein N-terminal domain-containing protein [Pseudomonadota bacterium]